MILKEKDLRFRIDRSTQPDSGLGLFAVQDIKKGDDLEVIGVLVERGSVSDSCTAYANSFKFAADFDDKMRLVPFGYGGMVNHANEKASQNVEIRYADGRVYYHFIRDVMAGEEVLGDYGEGWRAVSEWTKEKIAQADEFDEDEWNTFLRFDLYNLGKLKRYDGNAAD
jgi:hypothetical protein